MQVPHPPLAFCAWASGSLQATARGCRRETRGLSRSSALLFRTRGKRRRVLFPRAPAHVLLLPGRGGPLSPLTVDSIEKGCIPEPQCVPVKQRHTSLSPSGEGEAAPAHLRGEEAVSSHIRMLDKSRRGRAEMGRQLSLTPKSGASSWGSRPSIMSAWVKCRQEGGRAG